MGKVTFVIVMWKFLNEKRNTVIKLSTQSNSMLVMLFLESYLKNLCQIPLVNRFFLKNTEMILVTNTKK